jgi:hypothetical protein
LVSGIPLEKRKCFFFLKEKKNQYAIDTFSIPHPIEGKEKKIGTSNRMKKIRP